MKKNMGEYNEGLKRLYGSFRKRFGLEYSDTLEYADSNLDDNSYAILYFSSDITYSKEFIEEINSTGVGQAYGFYREGPTVSSVEEIKEAIPKIVGDGGNKFIFVELGERSRFRLENINKTVFMKLGREQGELFLDIVKSREYIDDEVIREMKESDKEDFNLLYKELFKRRWEMRKDIFVKNYKLGNSDISMICNRYSTCGSYLCFKNDKLVGFLLYEFKEEKEDGIENMRYLTIRDIYVLEEYRRQGIATRMFREVMQIASKSYTNIVRFKTWMMDEETVGFINSLNNKPLYTVYEIEL